MNAVKTYQKFEKDFNTLKWRLDELYRTLYPYMFLLDYIPDKSHTKEVREVWKSNLKKRIEGRFADLIAKSGEMTALLESMKALLFDMIESIGEENETS